MCGMELVPIVREYKRKGSRGTAKIVTVPKTFCDQKCYSHFMKRVWADEMGVKLKE